MLGTLGRPPAAVPVALPRQQGICFALSLLQTLMATITNITFLMHWN